MSFRFILENVIKSHQLERYTTFIDILSAKFDINKKELISLWNKHSDFKLPIEIPFENKCLTVIDSEGAQVLIYKNWLQTVFPNKNLLTKLKSLEWLNEKTPFGDDTKSRKIYAIGNKGLVHKYSSQVLELTGWDKCPELKEIMDSVNKLMKTITKQDDIFNSCLLNRYETGDNYLGYHSDKEALGYNNLVCAISVGATRDMLFKHIKTGELKKITLEDGDMQLMMGKCQKLWKHSIPKRKNVNEERISITFRCIRKKNE